MEIGRCVSFHIGQGVEMISEKLPRPGTRQIGDEPVR